MTKKMTVYVDGKARQATLMGPSRRRSRSVSAPKHRRKVSKRGGGSMFGGGAMSLVMATLIIHYTRGIIESLAKTLNLPASPLITPAIFYFLGLKKIIPIHGLETVALIQLAQAAATAYLPKAGFYTADEHGATYDLTEAEPRSPQETLAALRSAQAALHSGDDIDAITERITASDYQGSMSREYN